MNGNLIRIILAVVGSLTLVGGIVLSAGGLKKQIGDNCDAIQENLKEIKMASSEREDLRLVDSRREEQYKNLCEKMDAVLVQVNSLQTLMQSQAIETKTIAVQMDMIKESVSAIRTQVTEALKIH